MLDKLKKIFSGEKHEPVEITETETTEKKNDIIQNDTKEKINNIKTNIIDNKDNIKNKIKEETPVQIEDVKNIFDHVVKPDKELVENPEKVLKKILIEGGIQSFQKEFLVEHGLYLDFEKDAIKKIQEIAGQELKSIKQLCDDLFHDYFHGLRLMKLDNFIITKEAVEDPEGYLNNYIKNNYKK